MGMLTTEQRFKAETGQRFLLNGEIRCQALSKSQVSKWRVEHDDWLTPTDELWPECQCTKRAEPGKFVCYFHGGLTPRKEPIKSIFDVLPVDLGEKVRHLLGDPAYISRQEDIAVLRARQWDLLEKLQRADSDEAWGNVTEALYELQHGHEDLAANLLKDALTSSEDGKRLWQEYYEVEKILNAVTATEVKTAKELQSMATAEQVGRLINRIFEILTTGSDKYIDDTRARADFIRYIVGELNRTVNLSASAVVGLLESSSRETD
jgi:hypothetical protein